MLQIDCFILKLLLYNVLIHFCKNYYCFCDAFIECFDHKFLLSAIILQTGRLILEAMLTAVFNHYLKRLEKEGPSIFESNEEFEGNLK